MSTTSIRPEMLITPGQYPNCSLCSHCTDNGCRVFPQSPTQISLPFDGEVAVPIIDPARLPHLAISRRIEEVYNRFLVESKLECPSFLAPEANIVILVIA